MIADYPPSAAGRARWIRALRGERQRVNPWRVYEAFAELERGPNGAVQQVATLFLTNRECPWHCLFCDLWRHTLVETVPAGAIPVQIRMALAALPPAPTVKLFNAGSFFDGDAVPAADRDECAALVADHERVIVECHPALAGRAPEFARRIHGRLEVAMGLETIHPEVLPRLNKDMTVESFTAAARALRAADLDVRAFVLVGLPWIGEDEAVTWAIRSAAHAFDCGAGVVSLVATRSGNGALDELQRRGEFRPPTLDAIERTLAGALALGQGRVFVDLWGLGRFASCQACAKARIQRLRTANLEQILPAAVVCAACGAGDRM